MSYQQDRERFLITMSAEGLDLPTSRALLRYATTLQRLAEAQCNGDWPYNGDRDKPSPGSTFREQHDKRYTTCPKCEASGVAKSVMRGGRTQTVRVCPDCRTSELASQCLPDGFAAHFQGDPRGYVFYVTVPSGKRDYSDALGIGVPARY